MKKKMIVKKTFNKTMISVFSTFIQVFQYATLKK